MEFVRCWKSDRRPLWLVGTDHGDPAATKIYHQVDLNLIANQSSQLLLTQFLDKFDHTPTKNPKLSYLHRDKEKNRLSKVCDIDPNTSDRSLSTIANKTVLLPYATPLNADWNSTASAYRSVGEHKDLAITLSRFSLPLNTL